VFRFDDAAGGDEGLVVLDRGGLLEIATIVELAERLA